MSPASAVDAAAGVVLAGAACWALTRHRRTVGRWLVIAAVTWFVGSLVPSLALLHRAALVGAVVSTSGRPVTPRSRGAVLIIAAFAGAWWPNPMSSLLLGVGLMSVASFPRAGALDRPRVDLPTGLYGGLLVAVSVARWIDPESRTIGGAYAAGVILVLISMLVDGARHAERLELELLSSPNGTGLQDRLRAAVGDPTLRLTLDPSSPAADRGGTATTLYRAGRPVGTVLHAGHVRLDRRVLDGLGAIVGLESDALALRHAARATLEAIEQAGRDAARAREHQAAVLARQVEDGPRVELERAAELVRHLPVSEDVVAAQRELAAVAAGLAPLSVGRGGLRAALEALAAVSSVPVDISVDDDLPLDAEQTYGVFLICCEALANAAKHADALTISVDISVRAGLVEVEVVDDGVGGVDPEGSGVRGLFERAEAIGATLVVTSPPRGGTRVCLSISHVRAPA